MKTLLFCTSFAKDQDTWNIRYRKWVKFNRKFANKVHQIMIIDDGSPVLPDWHKEENIEIVTGKVKKEIDNKIFLYHYENNLGRPAPLNYPGWFRSFVTAGVYANKHNFDKVIHVESDSYLLSNRIWDFVLNIKHGWNALWCPLHKMPESAIQIICKDQMPLYRAGADISYNNFANLPIEAILPYTNVINFFSGDRYGEYANTIPKDADYVVQAKYEWDININK